MPEVDKCARHVEGRSPAIPAELLVHPTITLSHQDPCSQTRTHMYESQLTPLHALTCPKSLRLVVVVTDC